MMAASCGCGHGAASCGGSSCGKQHATDYGRKLLPGQELLAVELLAVEVLAAELLAAAEGDVVEGDVVEEVSMSLLVI